MKKHLSLFLTLVMSCALLLGGCSAAKLMSSWKDDGYTGKSVRMLVIDVATNKAEQQIFEATIVEKLKGHNIEAIPSYIVFSGEEMDKEAVFNYAKRENIDSVLVTKVLDSQSYNQRVSYATGGSAGFGGPSVNPYYHGFNGWYEDYSYWRANIISYDTQYKLSNLESNLYLLEGKHMVWSALVEVETVDNDKAGIKDLAVLLVKKMQKDGLI